VTASVSVKEFAVSTSPPPERSRPAGRTPHRWRGTSDMPPPSTNAYGSAVWLLGRHPQLAALVARVRDVIHWNDPDDPEEPELDLDALAAAVNALDAARAAWADYERRSPAPGWDAGDDAYEAWEAAGPPPAEGAAHDIAVMSRTEATRLRLLAVFAADGVRLSVHDLSGLDPNGQALLADWCRALYAY
jgi:hypothetical protein